MRFWTQPLFIAHLSKQYMAHPFSYAHAETLWLVPPWGHTEVKVQRKRKRDRREEENFTV